MATKGTTWKKCAAKGCRKYQIKYSVYCAKHGLDLAERTDRKSGLLEASGVLTALCAAVAAKYRAEGDTTKAGVVVAELSHDPPRFYASIARYPDGPMGKKQIVAQVGRLEMLTIPTAEDAVDLLAQKFASENRPVQVRKRLEELDAVLGLDDHSDDMEHT